MALRRDPRRAKRLALETAGRRSGIPTNAANVSRTYYTKVRKSPDPTRHRTLQTQARPHPLASLRTKNNATTTTTVNTKTQQ